MAPQPEKSQLKRALHSAGEEVTESKKQRRADDQQTDQVHPSTPLKTTNAAFPSPLTHKDTTTTADNLSKCGIPTPPSQGQLSTTSGGATASSPARNGITSPPEDTQPYSQFVYPPGPSYEVEDEEGEGVWGYLVPVDNIFGDSLVLRKRSACPIPGPTALPSGKQSVPRKGLKNQEEEYEKKKQQGDAVPAGGYLIGRHPECDRIIHAPTISNRHCLLFSENKDGEIVAVAEDLSANGTFINNSVIGRNKRRELKEGDEISIVDEARCVFRYPRGDKSTHGFRHQYTIQEQLGKGHFASVYLCVEKSTGIRFACKKFEKRTGAHERSRVEGLQQEIAVLMGVSHPSLLCLKDTFDEADGVYLVLELAPEGELFNWIVMKQKLSEAETRKVFVQLFQAVKYLHERNIVHRDIKPENILLTDKELHVKLADFGLAKIIGEESFTTTLCGTPSYVAPEILESGNHRRYTRAVDVWSLGVVLYICLCGFPPFSDELFSPENPYSLSQQIKMGRFDYPSPYWDSVGDPALDLIDRMLTVDVDKRATIDECLEHPWTRNAVNTPLITSYDSTDGLTGALGGLDFSKRKPHRERTMLSEINDVRVSRIIELPHEVPPVKVYEKNPRANGAHADGKTASPQKAKAKAGTPKGKKEDVPAENRDPEEFINMGGKGDQPLFGNDNRSIYPGDPA